MKSFAFDIFDHTKRTLYAYYAEGKTLYISTAYITDVLGIKIPEWYNADKHIPASTFAVILRDIQHPFATWSQSCSPTVTYMDISFTYNYGLIAQKDCNTYFFENQLLKEVNEQVDTYERMYGERTWEILTQGGKYFLSLYSLPLARRCKVGPTTTLSIPEHTK